jgi:hypothetical protein
MSGYCPAHDPILYAGHVRCPTCGHTGYPTDAEWLPDGTILAAYAAPCGHRQPAT